jgi:superfamily II DNA or RNA helicase
MRELRPYQQNAYQAIRDSIANGVKRIVVQGPCGFGKTLLSATIADGVVRKGKRMAFVVPAVQLVDQTATEFFNEGITDIGIIQADHPMTDWSRTIQICTPQTLQNRDRFPEADVVIFDEVHRWFSIYEKWMSHPDWKNVPFIGLSASPFTKGLGRWFDSLLVAATTQELIDLGYLSPYRVFATGHPDLSGVKVIAGEFSEKPLSEAMMKGTLTADIISTWLKLGENRPTFCFCVDRAHAKSVQERFIEAGIPADYQDANTPQDERREIKKRFHDGTTKVVCSIETMILGIDWDCRAIIWARPTKSSMLYIQGTGRGLRTADGKSNCIILDHAENTQRLGFISDIFIDQLDDGRDKPKTERQASLPKECPSCSALLAPGVRICPVCGFEKKPAISGIIEDDGELQEIKPGLLPKKKKGAKVEYTMAEKGQFYAELKGYAQEKSYKDGWSARKYMEKFGGWPDWSIKYVAPCTPSMKTASWIRSRQIAWIKSKKYAEQQAGAKT